MTSVFPTPLELRSRRPRRSPAQRRRLLITQLAIIVIALGVTIASSAVATSGAFFTDGKVVNGNSATAALVKIGGTGPDADPTAFLAVQNILPLSDTDAADNTKGVIVPLVIRNVGTVAIDWSATISGVTSATSTFPAALNVRVSMDNGVTWGATQSLATMAAIGGTGLAAPVPPATSQVNIKLRFWMDKAAANSIQGATASFTVTTKAIQSGVPLDTSGVTYPTS